MKCIDNVKYFMNDEIGTVRVILSLIYKINISLFDESARVDLNILHELCNIKTFLYISFKFKLFKNTQHNPVFKNWLFI